MSGSDGLEPAAGESSSLQGGFRTVAGERSTAAVHRVRSLESRVTNLMAIGLICALGFGLLVWYYSVALHRPAHAAQSAKALAASRAQAEMPLPSLGAIVGPALAPRMDPTSAHPAPRAQPSSAQGGDPAAGTGSPPMSQTLGALPLLAGPERLPGYGPAQPPSGRWNASLQPSPASAGVPGAAQRAFDRRLSGPVFARQSEPFGTSSPDTATGGTIVAASADSGSSATLTPASATYAGPSASAGTVASPGTTAHRDELTELLMPSATPAVSARVLPTQRLLLPKGAFIDCTLETAIDSTLPGMTTCITATDTFSADGKVVLLERGSKLVGETRGEVQQGSARVFVLWTEARTPTGVVIPLASPGTDELGRSGVSGQVDRHFWERFGAAILISIIDAAAESAVQSTSSTIIYNPTASQDVMGDVLKDTLRIPPTVVKNQGDRVQVLVARDLDFRSVYELRSETP
jgi:type IV secretion system protein VirB10